MALEEQAADGEDVDAELAELEEKEKELADKEAELALEEAKLEDADDANADEDEDAAAEAAAAAAAAGGNRVRQCEAQDQALAAGFGTSLLLGLGQQAAVLQLQEADVAAEFEALAAELTKLTDSQALQLQMAQLIANADNLSQTQIELLATAAEEQATLVAGLVDAEESAADLTTLLESFVTTTSLAQDAQVAALADCFIPVTLVVGAEASAVA